jgi:hypothetical protein
VRGIRAFVFFGSIVLLASACLAAAGGSASGTGWIISSLDPMAKSDIDFAFNCGPNDAQCLSPQANGIYHDPGASPAFPNGIKMKLSGVVPGTALGLWSPTGPVPDQRCAHADVTYFSTDPNVVGTGAASVDVCDNSHGQVKAPDTFAIQVVSGPYAGYQDTAPLGGGQITITPAPTTLP